MFPACLNDEDFSLCLYQRNAQRSDSETILTLRECVTIWKASDIQSKKEQAGRPATPHVEKAHRPSVLGNAQGFKSPPSEILCSDGTVASGVEMCPVLHTKLSMAISLISHLMLPGSLPPGCTRESSSWRCVSNVASLALF